MITHVIYHTNVFLSSSIFFQLPCGAEIGDKPEDESLTLDENMECDVVGEHASQDGVVSPPLDESIPEPNLNSTVVMQEPLQDTGNPEAVNPDPNPETAKQSSGSNSAMDVDDCSGSSDLKIDLSKLEEAMGDVEATASAKTSPSPKKAKPTPSPKKSNVEKQKKGKSNLNSEATSAGSSNESSPRHSSKDRSPRKLDSDSGSVSTKAVQGKKVTKVQAKSPKVVKVDKDEANKKKIGTRTQSPNVNTSSQKQPADTPELKKNARKSGKKLNDVLDSDGIISPKERRLSKARKQIDLTDCHPDPADIAHLTTVEVRPVLVSSEGSTDKSSNQSKPSNPPKATSNSAASKDDANKNTTKPKRKLEPPKSRLARPSFSSGKPVPGTGNPTAKANGAGGNPSGNAKDNPPRRTSLAVPGAGKQDKVTVKRKISTPAVGGLSPRMAVTAKTKAGGYSPVRSDSQTSSASEVSLPSGAANGKKTGGR